MANPYDQNYFGDNYYSFDNNPNNGFHDINRNRPQMRPFIPKPDMNYNHQNNSYGNKSINSTDNKTNNYYRRAQHPYFGQKNGATSGGQYRAQVIDYSSGPQSQSLIEPITRLPSNRFPNNNHQFGSYNSMNSNPSANNCSQPPMIRPQTGLLPPPHSYSNIRAYGQPSQNRGLLPTPSNQIVRHRFGSYAPPSKQMTYSLTNQSFNRNTSQSLSQQLPQFKSVPQPVPPPLQPQAVPLPVPPVVKQMSNPLTQPIPTKVKVEPTLQSQQKLEETRNKNIISEGMESRTQNEMRGFYCLFCEVFCNNLNAAERHVETPKHQRTKIGDNLRGIDAKFTIKSERISEMVVALARKKELNRISNVIKNEHFNEGIRLKDGIGPEAYVCENCGVSLDSLSGVTKHLETHKQFVEQLKICSKPVIGLDFIVEYIDPDPSKARVYECSMCHSFHSTREIISHVCSFRHRTNFIRKIHPSEGLKYTSESQQLSLEAGKRALELETLIGRGQFKVKHMAAPPNCLSKSVSLVSSDYNYRDSDDRMSIPKDVKPVIQIELPKPKSEQEKTELEKLFSVRLSSELEANEVTKVISDLTQSVMEYHMKGMTPQMREQFKKQLKDNEQNSIK